MSENVIPTNETFLIINENEPEIIQNIQIPLIHSLKNKLKTVSYLKRDEIENFHDRIIINECYKAKNMNIEIDNNYLKLEENIIFEDDNSMLNHSIKNLFS